MTHRFPPSLYILLILQLSCGTGSYFSCDEAIENSGKFGSCTPKSDDERVLYAMENSNWDDAIDLLSELITADAELPANQRDWKRKARLASAYAGKAGLNVLNAANEPPANSSIPAAFFPLPAADAIPSYRANNLASMRSAVSTLALTLANVDFLEIHEASTLHLAMKSQKKIYDAATAFMSMAMISALKDQDLSPEQILENITAADVALIIDSLSAVASESAEGDAIGDQASSILSQIDAAPGGTTSEKIINSLGDN